MRLDEPTASDGPQAHADWLELYALTCDDGNSSFQDLVAVIRRSGSMDALTDAPDDDRGSELSQSVADEAFSELDRRATACDGAYPFEISQQSIQSRRQIALQSPYIFMLLIQHLGLEIGPGSVKASTLFEELSAEAARRYLGGDAGGAEAVHFGSPRRTTDRAFADALDHLCKKLGEGGGARRARAAVMSKQKDAKLDLVAWRHFADRRIGKIVAFGQCAAGKNYDEKIRELHPRGFSNLWMLEPLALDPLTFFFMPRCLDDEKWLRVVTDGVVAFDRCRIAALLGKDALNPTMLTHVEAWTRNALEGVAGMGSK